ncbi:adhesion G-protein coupled receptor G6-like [Bolinopsis microptera]|uniref:adhesion G-protein coupled receptor G6-like n=1 Tax=Bolinopsis microptera TaxID=2820187 RepID=UPI0030797B69
MNEIMSIFSENSTLSESAYVSKKIENVTKELEDTTEKSGSSLTSNEVDQSVDIIERILSLGEPKIFPPEEPAALRVNKTSPEAALDHPPVLSPIALKTIMSTMDNIQKNTEVEDLRLDKTNDRLKTASVSISRKLMVVKQTDSNSLEDLIIQESVGFGVAKVKKGQGEDEKNILGLSGENNVLKNSSVPASQNEENVYFQAELETPDSMVAAVVFYQSDNLFPSDSTMNINLDGSAEQDSTISRNLAQLLRIDGSGEMKKISFVATIIADINIMDKITLQTNNSELKEDIALDFQVKDFAKGVIDYTKRKTSVHHSLDCKFYNDSLKDWSEQGCKTTTVFNESRNTYEVLCECDHLTSFAVLMTFESESSETEDMVSLVLLALSLFCLVLTLPAIFFIRERREVLYSQVKMMLTTALILSITSFFLMDYFVSADSHTDPSIPCSIISFLLNYFWLCQISWMVLLAITMYKALVKVFGIDIDHAFLKYCVVGWGVPIIFPTAGMAWGGRRFTDPKTCYIRHPYGLATFYGPLALGMLINWFVFFSIARVIFKAHETKAKKRRCSKIKLRQEQLKAALGVSTLLGLSWLVGFFLLMNSSNYSHISVVLRWLFILLNAPQGMLIFLFGVMMDKKVRSFWIQKLTCGRYGGKNSTQSGWQSRPGGSYFIPITVTTTTSPITGVKNTNLQTSGQQNRQTRINIAEKGAGRSGIKPMASQAALPRGRKVRILNGMRRSLTNVALHIRRPKPAVNQAITE